MQIPMFSWNLLDPIAIYLGSINSLSDPIGVLFEFFRVPPHKVAELAYLHSCTP